MVTLSSVPFNGNKIISLMPFIRLRIRTDEVICALPSLFPLSIFIHLWLCPTCRCMSLYTLCQTIFKYKIRIPFLCSFDYIYYVASLFDCAFILEMEIFFHRQPFFLLFHFASLESYAIHIEIDYLAIRLL